MLDIDYNDLEDMVTVSQLTKGDTFLYNNELYICIDYYGNDLIMINLETNKVQGIESYKTVRLVHADIAVVNFE